MRDFGLGHWLARVLSGILEAFIILVAVAVIAGVIFLLVRYLLVATRAAQLYVDRHEPPRRDDRVGGDGFPTGPTSPGSPGHAPTPPTESTVGAEAPTMPLTEATFAEPTAPTVSADTVTQEAATEKLPSARANGAPKTAAARPVTKRRTPKTPPAE